MNAPAFRKFAPKSERMPEEQLIWKSETCEVGVPRKGEFAGQTALIVPNPLPCTIIFVHGVNSEGEWYNQAEEYLCAGLNDRLGRWGSSVALQPTNTREFLLNHPKAPYQYVNGRPLQSNRPDFGADVPRVTSPVIRFYWGYKGPRGGKDENYRRSRGEAPAELANHFPVALDDQDAWGGGPFQNGTNTLWPMFRTDAGFNTEISQRVSPITDRFLTRCPPRTYMVHAARRLAHLIATIRRASPHETLNIVSHSQGTMVAGLAVLMLQEQGVRGPEALFMCNSPYSLNAPDGSLLESTQYGDAWVVSQTARIATLGKVAGVVSAAGQDEQATTDDDLERLMLSTDKCKPWVHRENYGNVHVYANAHDRVMGVSVLRSIGWRGLTLSEHGWVHAGPALRVRMFANNIEAGRGGYTYEMTAKNFDVRRDDDNRPIPEARKDFWFPSSEKIRIAGMDVSTLYTPPTEAQQHVPITAPTVPWRTDAALKAAMETNWTAFAGWSGRLEDFDRWRYTLEPTDRPDDQRDVESYRQVFQRNAEPVRTEQDAYGNQVTVYRTPEEALDALMKTAHNESDHSTLPGNEYIVRGVMAWDLAVGLNQCYTDPVFWPYLQRLADWKLSDPYFLENDEGALPEPGEPPPGLDRSLAWPKVEASY